jgi:CRISPR-associated protein (TIGR03986 family)
VVQEVPAEACDYLTSELAGRTLPRTAELVVEHGEILVDAADGVAVVQCTVKAVGPPHDRQIELRPKGSKTVVARLSVASMGIADPSFAGAAEAFDFLYAKALTPPGCWLCDGGIDAWLVRRQNERTAREQERAAASAERAATAKADISFVNPYTFVPFPARIARERPTGHAFSGEKCLSGTFTVVWEFTSPFQAPMGTSGTALLRLPGSSVKGAIRSVHEALAGGCLRVFDDQFIPSYRDTPSVRSVTWKMAVVTTATGDGQPLTVQLCDDVVWVPFGKLRAACGESLSTGSRVTIDEDDVPAELSSLGRKELEDEAVVRPGGDWVVLVTAPGTRMKETRSKKAGAYFLACGRLGQRMAEVSESAWRAFRLAVAGADDKRTAVRAEAAKVGTDPRELRPTQLVVFDGKPVGRRRVVTGWLWPGDVIWVNTEEAEGAVTVGELSLAAVWRHPGWVVGTGIGRDDATNWTAGMRVPSHVHACNDPESLCPSCRVFGSADARARGRDSRSEQRAYAGHVRFGDACSDESVELEEILRAPMGAPRPGAGQFYLSYDDTSPARSREDKPTREWGSAPDMAERRLLRGRKFYWHADPGRQDPPRHLARDHQKDTRSAEQRWIAPARTRLRQQVSFDNLAEADLGSLLATFQPQRVLPESPGGPPRLHLGGGKPLGLGSCFAAVNSLRVWTAQSRYGPEPEAPPDEESYLAAFTSQVPAEVTATWPALAAVLAESTVDAARVWYPPGAHWSDRRAQAKKFDEPFAFFTASSGMALHDTKKQPRNLIPLPAPDAGDQSMPIRTEGDLK